QLFTDFGITEAVAHVPPDRQGDDVVRKGAARECRTRTPREAATAVATSKPLATQRRGPVLGHGFRTTARAQHQRDLLPSAYPPHSAAREPLTDGTKRHQSYAISAQQVLKLTPGPA